MAHLTIGEVARQTELPPSTLRYYEQIGLLTPPREHGRRRYDRETVAQVAAIKLARRAGFTLAEIRELPHGFPADTPLSARWQAWRGARLPRSTRCCCGPRRWSACWRRASSAAASS